MAILTLPAGSAAGRNEAELAGTDLLGTRLRGVTPASMRRRHRPGQSVAGNPASRRQGTGPAVNAWNVAAAGQGRRRLRVMLNGTSHLEPVHGDACPDNVRMNDGARQIVHFQTWAGIRSPSTPPIFWRRSRAAEFRQPSRHRQPGQRRLPGRHQAAGTGLGPGWEHLTTAVPAGLIIACGHVLAGASSNTPGGEQPRCGPATGHRQRDA